MFIDLTVAVDMNDPIITKASKNNDSYMSRGHIGTHLDVYSGQEFPPAQYCVRRGVLIQIGDLESEIGVECLEGKDLQEGDFVIFYTGHLSRHTYATPEYYKTQPKFSWELVEHVSNRNFAFIGLDFPGMRSGEEHNTADRIVGSRGVYVIENLANIDLLNATTEKDDFELITGWTGFTGVSGLSCRVVARLQSPVA